MPIVSVRAADRYDPALLDRAVAAHFEALEVARDLRPGMRVLLKPNLLAARDPALAVTTHPEVLAAVARWLRAHGIEGLVVCGGDGSYRGARALAHRGIPMIGLPGTIDNDIGCTDYTIGYDTAMNTALEMIDKLRDTTQSHDRCSVVEVMGRNAGYIALNTGIAVGALVTLIPEVPYDLERDVIAKMKATQKTGKQHFIIIIAEGVGHAQDLANEIQSRTGIDSRATVLGHVQRGGSPTLRDRVTASRMGYHAVELLRKGIYNRVVATKAESIVDYDISVALSMYKTIDTTLLDIGSTISI